MNIWWRSFRVFHRLLKKLYYQYWYNIYCTGRTWRAVSEKRLSYYYGAADVVFIQRVKILNSGNAMMPMLFGKVVIGPDCGNVGPLLKQWGYPAFPIDDMSHLGAIVRKAIELEKAGVSVQKRDKQISEYATYVIVSRLYESYNLIIASPQLSL